MSPRRPDHGRLFALSVLRRKESAEDMSQIVFDIVSRDRTGTGGAREARREGLVPGVIYGGADQPSAISLKLNDLVRGLNRGGLLSQMIELKLDGATQKALIKDIQFHPVTMKPLHIDFFRVQGDQIVSIEVPVHFINEGKSPGLKRGGALNVVRHTIELDCPADAIPAEIVVDLDGLDINDSVHISAIALPPNVAPTISDRDFTIATITSAGPSASEEDDEAEGDGEESVEVPRVGEEDEDKSED